MISVYNDSIVNAPNKSKIVRILNTAKSMDFFCWFSDGKSVPSEDSDEEKQSTFD